MISGKADITFVEVAIAQAFLEKNPESIREVQDVSPVRVFPNVMMVGKGEYRLLSMLNVAIDVLANSGEIERIIAKYEEYPGSFQRRQVPYLPKR
jgi:ABC-type amino acid transport substrate-binding protein